MRRFISLSIFLLLIIFSSVNSNAELIINFDDLDNQAKIPSEYSGFNWVSWNIIDNDSYKSTYNNNKDTANFPSSSNAAFNSSGLPVAYIYRDRPFIFNGVSLSTWAQNDLFDSTSATKVQLTGVLNYQIVGTVTVNLGIGFNPITPRDWGGPVNSLIFETLNNESTYGRQHWFLMDNLRVSEVPLPPSVYLFGSGLIGLIGLRRFRRA